MTLDVNSPEGREIVRKLVLGTDVVVANMPPRTLQSLGLDYAALCRIKPDIILVASNAFGDAAAVRDRVGFDGVGQALSGAVHIAGTPDQPQKAMVPVVDFSTALACALGVMLALYERQRSGLGQEVGASLLRSEERRVGKSVSVRVDLGGRRIIKKKHIRDDEDINPK